jgi:DNA/RNA-binding domain of Phe-tRNA-synthetase-like protein
MQTRIDLEVSNDDLLVGLVEGSGLVVGETSPELRRTIEELVSRRASEDFPPAEIRTAIRKLLRTGGFDPSGRSKPASEYLAGRARAGAYPFHSNVVDIGNYISLLSGLPISVVDADLALAGAPGLVIRLGREGESYVFNPAGQEIRIEGLLSLARADGPAVGNPVKDSMGSKVHGGTRRAVGIVYASKRAAADGEMERYLDEFARLLRLHASAAETACSLLRG